jgi:hypothetical protein
VQCAVFIGLLDAQFSGRRISDYVDGDYRQRSLMMWWRSRALKPTALVLVDVETVDPLVWKWINSARAVSLRRWCIPIGIGEGQERARLLRRGFGDVCDPLIGLAELHARGLRLQEQAEMLVRWRHHGPLRLDLIERDAFVGKKGGGVTPWNSRFFGA